MSEAQMLDAPPRNAAKKAQKKRKISRTESNERSASAIYSAHWRAAMRADRESTQHLTAQELISQLDRSGAGRLVARRLMRLIVGKGVQDSVRMSAIREWLDRTAGRPVQMLAVAARIDDAGARRLSEVLERMPHAMRAALTPAPVAAVEVESAEPPRQNPDNSTVDAS